MSYDTSTPDGVRNAASFVQGWLGSHEIEHEVRDFDGLPVILATVGPPVGPTVVLHGHIDVVPAHSAQFAPRIEGDRLVGRGAYDMKGGLAAMMCALVDVARQHAVRVVFMCVPDEESEDVEHRSTDTLVAEGLTRRLRDHRGADRSAHRRPGEGRPRDPARGARDGRTRLDTVARRQRDPEGPRRLPSNRDPAVQPRELRAVRPPLDLPERDRRAATRSTRSPTAARSTWTSAISPTRSRRPSSARSGRSAISTC